MTVRFKNPKDEARFTRGPTIEVPQPGFGWMNVVEQERLNPGIQWDQIITDPHGVRWGRILSGPAATLKVTGVNYKNGVITVGDGDEHDECLDCGAPSPCNVDHS